MGPRIREGVEGREYPAARFFEGLGMTCGVRWGNGRFANCPYGGRGKGGKRGMGSACARTMGGGVGGRAFPEPLLRGVGSTAYDGRPQGSLLRGEDGRVGKGNGSPHSRGQREGGKDIHPITRLHGARLCARATGGGGGGSPPSPVFTRAGSNLPPSRGKGFVGAERAVFIGMTGGDLGR